MSTVEKRGSSSRLVTRPMPDPQSGERGEGIEAGRQAGLKELVYGSRHQQRRGWINSSVAAPLTITSHYLGICRVLLVPLDPVCERERERVCV